MDRPLAIMITGASSGIGRAVALELAREGIALYLVARRASEIDNLAEACVSHGAFARTCPTDLCDWEQLDQACEDFALRNPEARLCVVNAAGNMACGDYGHMHWQTVQEMMDLMLMAPMRIVHRLLGPMGEQGGGRIINVLSIAACHTFSGIAAYSTAKAAMRKFGEAINAEYRAKGITSTSVILGATDTAIWDSVGYSPDKADMLSSGSVASEIAKLVFLPANRAIDEIVLMPPKGVL